MTTANMTKTAGNKSIFHFLALFAALVLLPWTAQADPMLNGLAVSTELGKDRFIAALYTDSLSNNSSEVLSSTSRRSMELKILADSLSARSLNNMWIEGIAINNSSSALEKEANNTLRLTQLVRRKLVSGDTLRLNFEVGKGVDVVLNGIQLGNIPSDEFFNMILRTWIGNVPLSSDFRDGLLASGKVDDALLGRYSGIQPQPGRAEEIAAWSEQGSSQSSTSQQIAAAPAPAKPRVEIDAPKPRLALGELAAPTINNISQNEQKKAAATEQLPARSTPAPAQQQPKPPATETNPIAVAEPKTTPPVTPPTTTETKPQNTLAMANTPPRPVPAVVEEEEEEEEYNLESIQDRLRYFSQLKSLADKQVGYPPRAQERNQQGTVRIKMVIANDGTVKESVLVEESRYRLLNQEVLAMVERVSPFPPFPATIKDEEIEFTQTVNFVLKD